MKLFLPIALVWLGSCALADDMRSKRRLIHSNLDLAEDTSAQNEPGSMETAGSSSMTTAFTSAPIASTGVSPGHDRAELDGPVGASDTGTTRATGTATSSPRRKNKKGSSRRSGTKTSDQETRGDNGPKRKSNRNQKKKIIPNSKLLARLGLKRVESGSHYRKRLAGTSQRNDLGTNYKGHQKRILENLDSRMYVIKLPPSSYYYSSHNEDKFRLSDPGHKHLNNLGINFNSNGKPSKVYHYNIPIINKIVGRKTNSNFYKYDDDINDPVFLGQGAGESSIYNVQTLESHTAASNELGLPGSSNLEQDKSSLHKKYGPKKSVTYMKPKPAKQFTKYFPSNGKPHAFYIIENSSTPYYHRLLP